MEPKLKEIIELVKSSTNKKSLTWVLNSPNNNNILDTKLGDTIVRLTNSGANLSFQLIENGNVVAAHAEVRNQQPNLVVQRGQLVQAQNVGLYDLYQNALRQATKIDEKLDKVIEELKKKNSPS